MAPPRPPRNRSPNQPPSGAGRPPREPGRAAPPAGARAAAPRTGAKPAGKPAHRTGAPPAATPKAARPAPRAEAAPRELARREPAKREVTKIDAPPRREHANGEPSKREPANRDPLKPRAPRSPQATRTPDKYLYGTHAVREALLNPDREITRIQITDAGRAGIADALALAAERGIPRPAPETVDKPLMDRFLRGAVHQGVAIEIVPIEPPDLDDVGRAASVAEHSLVVVLDQVTDPHNVGAIMRSAAAFGASALVVTERNAPEITGTLAKAASGAAEHVPIVRVKNLARALASLGEWGFRRIGLAEDGDVALADVEAGPHVALVLGAEGEGLRHLTREHCDVLARLPTGGPIGSLNVSNAAAVALYEIARRR